MLHRMLKNPKCFPNSWGFQRVIVEECSCPFQKCHLPLFKPHITTAVLAKILSSAYLVTFSSPSVDHEKTRFCIRGTNQFKRVFHDRPVWRISVRLSDRSEVTQHKINFIKNCPQWGLNSQPLDHQSNALPDELSHYLVVCVNH